MGISWHQTVSRGRQCQKTERGLHYWSAFSGYGTDKFLTGGGGGGGGGGCLDYLSLGSLNDTGFPCPQ